MVYSVKTHLFTCLRLVNFRFYFTAFVRPLVPQERTAAIHMQRQSIEK